MANNIQLFQKYIALLDEVYQLSSKSSILDGDASLVQAGRNTNEIIIPKMSLDGLADYSRNSGYVKGDVDIFHALTKDDATAFTGVTAVKLAGGTPQGLGSNYDDATARAVMGLPQK